MAGGNKICLGCNAIGRHGSSGRCGPCLRLHKAKYADPVYIAQRHADAQRIASGAALDCPRCGEPIMPGDDWDEGHQGDGTLHPEHSDCNRAARRAKGIAIV